MVEELIIAKNGTLGWRRLNCTFGEYRWEQVAHSRCSLLSSLPSSLDRYARVLLTTRALTLPDLDPNLFYRLYGDAFFSATAFLGLYLDSLVPQGGVVWGHNPTVVTPTYCSIFLIHVIANVPDAERRLGVAVEATYDLIARLVEALEYAGSITPHRRGAAGSYGPYLKAVLAKTREKRQDQYRQQHQQQRQHHHQQQYSQQVHHHQMMKSPRRTTSNEVMTGPMSTESIIDSSTSRHHSAATMNLRPPITPLDFQAGPSGVLASGAVLALDPLWIPVSSSVVWLE